jgi:hypothetical protein
MTAPVEAGLSYLLSLEESQGAAPPIDVQALMPVVDFIRQSTAMTTQTPAQRRGANGSSISFSIARSLPEIMRYAYNNRIPISVINPSSVNFGYWKEVQGRGRELPNLWESLNSLTTPLVVRGVMRESITPDLHSGAYYDYDLNRIIVAFRQGSAHVVISLSDQIGSSEVGRKGYIVGPDQDWNYLYTQEQGLNKAGLGWVKSKIYKFFAVCFYIQDDARPNQVQVGTFQWLNAGWAGINMVGSDHIRRGLQRYATQIKALMESPKMPSPQTLENVYTALQGTDEDLLRERMAEVTSHIRRKAELDESISNKTEIGQIVDQEYADRMSKEEMISALMKEYVKLNLGKETPLGRSFWVALKPREKRSDAQPAM